MQGKPYALHLGNCLEILRTLPDNSIDSIVTDPPYGLSFMGNKWDYDVPSAEVWAECLRVLKPGGHLLAFAGTRTQHRMAVRIEDAGFEIRDMIAWVYGSGFPKSHNLGGDWQGWGTALKPALEPITVARKPIKGTVAANVLAHGTGALNIDGCRVATDDNQSRPRGSFPHSDDAWGNGRPDEVSESHTGGRWPANLIHDGSGEVVGVFPVTTSGGRPKPGTPRTKANTYGEPTVSEPRASGSTTGSAARFYYCAKTSRKDRNEGLLSGDQTAVSTNATMRDRENADWQARNGNHHPTVKPTDLMAYLCRLVTPPDGTVLDPFMGSGSTGKAAIREGFRFIGCELAPDYLAIAEARIANELTKAQTEQCQQELAPDGLTLPLF